VYIESFNLTLLSQGKIVVSPLRHLSLLVLHDHQGIYDTLARLFRPDYVINKATLSGFQWVGECLLIFRRLFFNILPPKDNLDRSFSPHHSDFSRRPRVIKVSLQVLGGHDIVCAAVRLASDEGDFGDGGFSVSEKEFCAVLDDAAELLGGAW